MYKEVEMTLFAAIRDYLNRGNPRPVTLAELKEFKDSVTPQDRLDYARELEAAGYEITS